MRRSPECTRLAAGQRPRLHGQSRHESDSQGALLLREAAAYDTLPLELEPRPRRPVLDFHPAGLPAVERRPDTNTSGRPNRMVRAAAVTSLVFVPRSLVHHERVVVGGQIAGA